HVYLDSNPQNANTPTGGTYGTAMYCSNNYTCIGRFTMPVGQTSPFTTPALDAKTFPAGTWYVQVETTNNDQFASTRQFEESNVLPVTLAAGGGGTTTTQGNTASTAVTVSGTGTVVRSDGGKEQVANSKVTLYPD